MVALSSIKRGSPPHAWGRPAELEQRIGQHRFTPTCVGKTRWPSMSMICTAVHPHMRGEDDIRTALDGDPTGSPPHAWGRLHAGVSQRLLLRFTPTCVGKTSDPRGQSHAVAVHPHMRGEDDETLQARWVRVGSPPHAWGRPGDIEAQIRLERFTPTCVGKTSVLSSQTSLGSVHPHMRGEDVEILGDAGQVGGSPPHAWGRLSYGLGIGYLLRFTPTCVGKTCITRTQRAKKCGSPPTCVGKTGTTGKPGRLRNGSPPHAWGRRTRKGRLHVHGRFTPTCVGKTQFERATNA